MNKNITDFRQIHSDATIAAKKAVRDFLSNWNEKTGGNEYGEPMYCGFSWVDVKVRSNSKLGKAMLNTGFEKSWERGYLNMWNPADYHGQSMDVKQAGARAYAQILRNHGIEAYAGSRAD